MMMFFLIPYIELTQEMINLSTSNDKTQVPVRYYSAQPFYVLEVEQEFLSSAVFKIYRQYWSHELDKASPSTPNQKLIFVGIRELSGECAAGTSTGFSYTVPENRILQSIVLGVFNSTFLDYIDITIYSGETLVSEKAKQVYVVDGRTQIDISKSLVPANLIIKMVYTNTDAQNVAKIFTNLIWSKE